MIVTPKRRYSIRIYGIHRQGIRLAGVSLPRWPSSGRIRWNGMALGRGVSLCDINFIFSG